MPIKHQTDCFRNIKGVRYENYMDLIQGEKENQAGIKRAKEEYKNVRIMGRTDLDYKQVFVANKK